MDGVGDSYGAKLFPRRYRHGPTSQEGGGGGWGGDGEGGGRGAYI